MAALNFPAAPNIDDVYNANGKSYRWNGVSWINEGTVGPTGFTGSQGDAGAAGFTGSQGIQGVNGFTGSVGFVGSAGAAGVSEASTKWYGAGEFIPRVTNGAGIDGEETATNFINLDYLAFDQTAAEFAQVVFRWPGAFTTFTVIFHWTAATGTGTVTWTAAARCYPDDDALNQAMGTAQSVTDTLTAVNDAHKSDATPAITPAGTVADGNLTMLQIGRDIADTLTADARFIGAQLEFA